MTEFNAASTSQASGVHLTQLNGPKLQTLVQAVESENPRQRLAGCTEYWKAVAQYLVVNKAYMEAHDQFADLANRRQRAWSHNNCPPQLEAEYKLRKKPVAQLYQQSQQTQLELEQAFQRYRRQLINYLTQAANNLPGAIERVGWTQYNNRLTALTVAVSGAVDEVQQSALQTRACALAMSQVSEWLLLLGNKADDQTQLQPRYWQFEVGRRGILMRG